MEFSTSQRDTVRCEGHVSVVFKNQDGKEVTVYLSSHQDGFSIETDTDAGMMYNESTEQFEDLK